MTQIKRPRLLYYCLSLVGIGHLTASLHIIKELLNDFDIDLIYGGIDYSGFPEHDGFRVLQLPALLLNNSGELYAPEKSDHIETVWQLRQDCIHEFVSSSYQGVIVEFYPFGRRRFKREIRSLIKHVQSLSGEIPVFSQVREVLVSSDLDSEQKILDIINAEIHTVLVRGDPDIISLDETFSLTSQLGERLFYAGYISPPAPKESPVRGNSILVSQGGGNVGQQLLSASVQVASLLPDYRFLIATGSGASPADINYLQSLVQSPNVSIVPFLTDFRSHLLTSALSINMGGDNTLLDMIATQTPSLAFPYPGNTEQALRIEKLAKNGWVTQLKESDLNPNAFKHQILSALSKPYPTTPINLNGAANICQKVKEIIANSNT
jgi:predicted glycosyltransferase